MILLIQVKVPGEPAKVISHLLRSGLVPVISQLISADLSSVSLVPDVLENRNLDNEIKVTSVYSRICLSVFIISTVGKHCK